MESFGKNFKYNNEFDIEEDDSVDPYSEIPVYFNSSINKNLKNKVKKQNIKKIKENHS